VLLVLVLGLGWERGIGRQGCLVLGVYGAGDHGDVIVDTGKAARGAGSVKVTN